MLYNIYPISPTILPKILFVCLIQCIMMLFYLNNKGRNFLITVDNKNLYIRMMIIIIHIDKRTSLYVIAPHAKTMPFSSIYFFLFLPPLFLLLP
ncbi:hypothetical protein BDC45DRAFT_526013 [Circinella umbellata]|nr:hypothetical protein BDC45DRAFT_526013 [Circinella umbellata]